MKQIIKHAVLIAVMPFLTGVGYADANKDGLKLIELFTSHGCSSCPAADKLLAQLLEEQDDLLALEYHVDYWNGLVHGSDGSFTDPFSNAENSARQREYNHANMAGRPGVYTPQAVVNGRTASVGSNKSHIVKALSARTEPALDIAIESDGQVGNRLNIIISGQSNHREELTGIDVRLVSYIDKATTDITGGENRNLVLVNHNIVMSASSLGEVTANGDLIFNISRPAEGRGCLVLIQEEARTPVYAAAECP